jgi:hypothetical protein
MQNTITIKNILSQMHAFYNPPFSVAFYLSSEGTMQF